MKISVKWIGITMFVFWFLLIGFCQSSKAQDQVNYVEPTKVEMFCEQVEDAWSTFLENINRDMTDMGIVNAQRALAKRIDSILSNYEMDTDAEKLQAEEEERKMDQQGIWKDMTNNH